MWFATFVLLAARPSPFVWFLLLFVAVGALIVAVLWTLQRQLIYFPGGTVPPVEHVLPGWWDVRFIVVVMAWRVGADAVVTLHLTFVVFVVRGGLAPW